MAKKGRRSAERGDALSKRRIVEAAIDILDREGEQALTFRALSRRLSSGSGALYWHIADRGELLASAADLAVDRLLTDVAVDGDPKAAIRTLAIAVFDTIDLRPWLGEQIARNPSRPALLKLLERIGRQVEALDVANAAQFDAATALLNYILGVTGQNAANARAHADLADRNAGLEVIAERWASLDADDYRFVHKMAAELAAHDDREQFLAGIDIILKGVGAGD